MAWQSALARRVALKASIESLRDNPVVRERFRREAVLVAAITHPNVIAYYDFGIDEDGDQILVMEYLRGKTLFELLRRRGPLPLPLLAKIVKQAACGLSAVHARGLVHRDIKPSNLFLTDPGTDTELLKVIDFGILRATGPEASGLERLTRTAAFIGTPAYAAPEMLLGLEPSPASDQYALALVVLELLTGKKAWTEDSGVARLESTPPALDLVGGPLQDVLRRALAPDPGGRFHDILSFSAAVEGALAAAAEATRLLDVLSNRLHGTLDQHMAPGNEASRNRTPARGAAAAPARRRRLLVRFLMLAGLLALVAAVVGLVAGDGKQGVSAQEPPPGLDARMEAPEPQEDVASSPKDCAPEAPVATRAAEPLLRVAARPRSVPGLLVLNAFPWAEVSVDGKARGKTPIRGLEVQPGRHVVEFRNPAAGTVRYTPTVGPGETLRLCAWCPGR